MPLLFEGKLVNLPIHISFFGVLGMRLSRIWYGVGFGVIPLLVLVIGYFNVHPELYRSIPGRFGASNDAPYYSIAWGEDEQEDPPLEYISDSYEGVQVWTKVVDVESFWSLWNTPNSEIEFDWEYQVKNLSDETRLITVEYMLEDSREIILVSSEEAETAEPGETVTIKGSARIDYHKAQTVANSTWSIGHRVSR